MWRAQVPDAYKQWQQGQAAGQQLQRSDAPAGLQYPDYVLRQAPYTGSLLFVVWVRTSQPALYSGTEGNLDELPITSVRRDASCIVLTTPNGTLVINTSTLCTQEGSSLPVRDVWYPAAAELPVTLVKQDVAYDPHWQARLFGWAGHNAWLDA